MQINYYLLDATCDINENLFRGDLHFTIMSSNRNELITKHQQEGVLIALRGEVNKIIAAFGADDSGLGRWNWIQL